MTQKVHSVSYLAKAEFELKNGVYDLVALPAGAEVVKMSLEVEGNANDSHVVLKFKDEITKDFFVVLDDAVSSNKTATIAKDYTVKSNKVVVAEVTHSNNDTKVVLRVLYFLPSVIEVEY
ncbi:hypothetical protein [Helicobacter pylori]|uniref:hypothetical protein n=1 Tax=Helicobacter pylori TaxID=210 RepID=UPI000EB22D7A|nr:hypothetical protein [Helicobacter pylori]